MERLTTASDDSGARVRRAGPATAALVGLLAGFLSGLFGVGGGILIVPGLVLLLRMEQRSAHGTSLAAIVLIALSGVGGFALHDSVDWPVAALLTAGSAAGALVGTHLLERLDQRVLRLFFAALLVVTAVRLFLEVAPGTGRALLDASTALSLVGIGVIAGTLAGLLGVGGGIVMVPAMTLLFSMPDAIAKGTSLLVIIPTAIVGTIRNVQKGNADLKIAFPIGVVGSGSAFAASQIAVRLDPRVSAILFGALIVAVAARMLLQHARDE